MSVAVVYGLYILAAGTVSILLGLPGKTVLPGLGCGFLVVLGNYRLLNLAVGRLFGKNSLLAVQILILRYVFYGVAAYLCYRCGEGALLMFAAAVCGLPLAVFIVYGIGGRKTNDTR